MKLLKKKQINVFCTQIIFILHISMISFSVIRELGRGSNGRAFLVEARDTGTKYVIKQINLESLDSNEKEKAKKEAELLKKFKHDNIIKIYGSGVHRDKLDMLIEYCDGGDLNKYITRFGRHYLSEEDVIEIFTQICLGVKYLHDRKVLHRDLKPGNILMCSDGKVKIADFGFARTLGSTMEQVHTIVGTPLYLSPELCQGHPYSAPSDIWGLGCILYELCAHRKPFIASSINEVIQVITSGKLPRFPSCYSNDLRSLFKDLLLFDQTKRPTINQILNLPIVKFKAMALLGEKTAKIELTHSVFHGLPACEVPDDYEKALSQICINIPNDESTSHFSFMGKPLNTGECKSPEKEIQYVKNFIINMVGTTRYEDLYTSAQDEREILDLTNHEEYVYDLINQLIDFENSLEESNQS